MTSESLRLGSADAVDQWVGVRRLSAVLAVAGVGLVGDWALRRGSPAELLLGVVVLVGTAPVGDGQSLAELVGALTRYLARAHWASVTALASGDDVILWAGSDVALRGYELDHRGRLDLNGGDYRVADGLASTVDALAAGGSASHLSLHVLDINEDRSTLLALPSANTAPEGWRLANGRLLHAIGCRGDGVSTRYLERVTYVRSPSLVLRVFRVRDFSSVPNQRGLLEQLLRSRSTFELALHVEIVAGAKSHRVAARGVHRVDSDASAARSAGFRRTARTAQQLERWRAREALVADGRALVRVGIFLVVRASTLSELNDLSRRLRRDARDTGVQLERGRARQGHWWRNQLPGGLGW